MEGNGKDAGALVLLEHLESQFAAGIGTLSVYTESADILWNALSGVAADIDGEMEKMLQEGLRVVQINPWRCGLVLSWLCDEIEPATGSDLNVEWLTRYQVFQKAGFWHDLTFNQWATESTGVQYGTWRGWMNAVRTYLLSEKGAAIVTKVGGVDKFIGLVSMDKALRAAAIAKELGLEQHHIDALVDPGISSERMRHVLRLTGEEWEGEKARQVEADEKFVAEGGENRWWIEYDEADRTLRLMVYEDGRYDTGNICRLPVASSEHVKLIQHKIITFAEAMRAVADGLSNTNTEIMA